MNWDNLFSGLLGAIVGGVLSAIGTYFATTRAAKSSMSDSLKADSVRRKTEESAMQLSLLRSLLAEIDDNLHLAEEIRVGYAKIRLLTDAYEQLKRQIQVVPAELIEPLRDAYASAMRFNVLAEYEQEKVNPGIGTFDDEIAKRANLATEKFTECKKILEDILTT